MREILFRGKRMRGNYWVEGALIFFAAGGTCICVQGDKADILNKYDVENETVGQYTGLTDKNGKKILRAIL